MANKVLWLSSEKWKYPAKRKMSHDFILPDFHYVRITETRNNWSEILANPDEWLHVVIIITEPVLLLMCNQKYKKAFNDMLGILDKHNIEHTIMMFSNIYNGDVSILDRRYYYKYLFFDLYKLHRESFFGAIRNIQFWQTNGMVFREFISDYLVNLVSQLHDHGYIEYAIEIANRSGDFFDDQEKTLIQFPSSKLVICNYEEDMIQRDEDFGLVSEYNPYHGTWERRMPSSGMAIRNVEGLSDWDVVRHYLDTQGMNKISSKSKRILENELDDEVFETLVEFFQLRLTVEDKHNCLTNMLSTITELKNREKTNVLPFDGVDDLLMNLEDYIGASRYIVFSKYVLHDSALADAMDGFMTLFQEYISVYKQIDLKFEKMQTKQGSFYVIKTTNPTQNTNVSELSSEFYSLLDAIQQKPNDISSIVNKYHLPPERADAIIRKYNIEVNRIMEDTKYNIQSKLLNFCNELGNDINNAVDKSNDGNLEELLSLPSTINELYKITFHDPRLRTYIHGDSKLGELDMDMEKLICRHMDYREGIHEAFDILNDPGIDNIYKKKAKRNIDRQMDAFEQDESNENRALISDWRDKTAQQLSIDNM